MNYRHFILLLFFVTIGLTLPCILSHHFLLLIIFWFWLGFFFVIPGVWPNCPLFGPVILRFQTKAQEVWLTFDDGPDPMDTPQILDHLARHEALATFFVIGKRAERYPELIREILRRGHRVENHSYSHPSATFWMAGPGLILHEVDACARAISLASGKSKGCYFRAPVGMANFFVAPVIRKRNLQLIGWSARGFDAVESDPTTIVNRIWRSVCPGAIILLHEGHHQRAQSTRVNPECLALLLEKLRKEGYSAVLPRPAQLK